VRRRAAGFIIHAVDSENERQEARRLVTSAREISRAILDGETTPYDGARAIAAMCRKVPIHPPIELHTFVYADSEWGERPDDGSIFEDGVVAAARELTTTEDR
jgi:hypothetical protein